MKEKKSLYKMVFALLAVIGILVIAMQGNKEENIIAEKAMLENKIEDTTGEEPDAGQEQTNEVMNEEPEEENAEEVQEEYEYADFAFADVNDYVNVRNQPSTEGEIVGKIYDGAVAEILSLAGENDEWYQIVSGDVEGYIKAEFFLRGEEAASVMDKYITRYAKVIADKLNVRKEPSVESKRVGYLNFEERVKVVETEGEWIRIQYAQEKEGYVAAEYVVISEEFNYAKTLEEEAKELAEKAEREQRETQAAQVENIVEEIVVVPPAVTYTSNESLRQEIVNYALQYVGNRYVSGGRSLSGGTDCSGFTCFVYADFGYSISRTPSGQMSGSGRSIGYEEIQPGDIICYSSNGGKSCTHVGMYIGNGQIVHSANSRKGVIISGADFEPIIGVKNVID
ncbi:MAG: SH3 domain-containing protein [Lachnospiraceae bacterium]|nr:SH3 domain-containing protein [Lachnospiraceae bacterium]